MEQKVRILQLLPSDDPGVFELCKIITDGFNEAPYELTTALFHSPSKPINSKNFVSFHFKKSDMKGLRLKALWQLYSFCRKEKFDVIITHRFKPLHMMLIINKLLQTPAKCISVIHGFGDFNRSYRRFNLNLLWDKDWHFVGISEPVSIYLKRILKRAPSNVTTINNCIDVEAVTKSLHKKQHSRELLGLSKNTFVFGTIGRLVPLKGHMNLLKAFELVLENHPNSQLLIIGEGRERNNLETYIKKHNLDSAVILAGRIEHAASLLKAFDIFVLPSLKEGFGLVLLEAMAAKLPIIASNTGGIPSIIKNKESLFSPIDDYHMLAKSMQENTFINNNLQQKTDLKLHNHLSDHFDIQHYQKAFKLLIMRRISTVTPPTFY